jgi:hypothetical protein
MTDYDERLMLQNQLVIMEVLEMLAATVLGDKASQSSLALQIHRSNKRLKELSVTRPVREFGEIPL